MKKNYFTFSKKYREEGKGQLSKEEVASYVAARMPATFAAARRVLQEVAARSKISVERTVDLGAGTGAATLAAMEIFPNIQEVCCIEGNPHMVAEGKKRVLGEWIEEWAEGACWKSADLAILCYSYGEMTDRLKVLMKVWENARVIVLIEAGTPRGYRNMLEARKRLIEWGGEVIAPCPHGKPCPLKGDDWCHFSVRLERSKEHRAIKGGDRGWEDEKYSYIAVQKESVDKARARILRAPQKKSGHVALRLCMEEGVVDRVVSRKEGALYKSARKSSWGDDLLFEDVVEEGD